MLDYGMLPPEINSAKMYSGPGSGSMIAAAAAWDVLANGLESASRGYSSAIARLQGESWSGTASEAMASAVAPYVAWMMAAGMQAEQAASQARAAAAAYEAAFSATVPPPLVTANRSRLASLVATNILGQNTPMIGETEAAYEQMWAQDAAAMYTYAASSSAASRLGQFSEPPQTTDVVGQAAQTAAVTQATSNSTAGNAQTTLSQVMSTVPKQLQALATAASTNSSSSSSSSSTSTPLASFLTKVGNFNTLIGPANSAGGFSRTATSMGSFIGGSQRSIIASGKIAADQAAAAAKAAKAASTVTPAGISHGPVLASAGNAAAAGKLSVPQGWGVANPAATTVADTHWLSDTELDGGPSWHEAPATNMWNGVPAAGTGTTSALSRPSINNLLRVVPRKFTMPRPSAGG